MSPTNCGRRRRLSWCNESASESPILLLSEDLSAPGAPDSFNTDQSSQFTSEAFTGLLAQHAIAINMDDKGARRDNVFIERLLKSAQYQEVDLRAYDSDSGTRQYL